MRHITAKLFVAIIAVFILTYGMNAAAQTSIAVVDVDRILAESQTAKALNTKRDAIRKEFLSRLSTKEQELSVQMKDLYEKRKTVSEEEYVKLQKDYETKLLETRKLAQKQKMAFEKASSKSLLQLKSYLTDTVQQIAQEKSYDLVISSRDVIAGQNSLDITNETLTRMDAGNKTIAFSMSE